MYRMSKSSVYDLVPLIEPHLPPTREKGRKSVPIVMKLLITLQYLAGGNFKQTTALCHECSQKTVSNIVIMLTSAIGKQAPVFIVFPDHNERGRVAQEFYDMVTKRYPHAKVMPRVIGAVDGTQVNILGQGAGVAKTGETDKTWIKLK